MSDTEQKIPDTSVSQAAESKPGEANPEAKAPEPGKPEEAKAPPVEKPTAETPDTTRLRVSALKPAAESSGSSEAKGEAKTGGKVEKAEKGAPPGVSGTPPDVSGAAKQGGAKAEKGGEERGKSDDGGRPRRAARRGREEGRSDRRSDRGGDEEYIDRLVSINRVAKVVKGGRRFGFSALIVVGDGAGKVGCASGKAREISEAIRKATERAKRQMVKVPLREGRTLHHDIRGRHGAGKVILRAAPTGTGIIAGGPMRAIFEALGVQDVVAKSVGSSNPHNMIRATFDAFSRMLSPRRVASKRSRNVRDVVRDRV